jgi:hypothetical protein
MSLTLRIASVAPVALNTLENDVVDISSAGHTITFEYGTIGTDGSFNIRSPATFTDTERASIPTKHQIVARMSSGALRRIYFNSTTTTNTTTTYVLNTVVRNLTPGTQYFYGIVFGTNGTPSYVMVNGSTTQERSFTVLGVPGNFSTRVVVNSSTNVSLITEGTGSAGLTQIYYEFYKTTTPEDYTQKTDNSSNKVANLTSTFDLSSGEQYTFDITYFNEVASITRKVFATATLVPSVLPKADVTIVSNLEIEPASSRSSVAGGVTVFFKLPSNFLSLASASINAPVTHASIQLRPMVLNGNVWNQDTSSPPANIIEDISKNLEKCKSRQYA